MRMRGHAGLSEPIYHVSKQKLFGDTASQYHVHIMSTLYYNSLYREKWGLQR